MNYFRTDFCEKTLCLVTFFSLGQFCLPFWKSYLSAVEDAELQIFFFFFCFPVSCHACSFFFVFLLFLLLLLCPSFFLPFLFSLFIVQAEHLLSLWIYFRTSFLQPTLEERIFIFLYSLLCQVRKVASQYCFKLVQSGRGASSLGHTWLIPAE